MLQDEEIIELYFKRDDTALEKTAEKYKNYCISIAERILGNKEDAEEIWNDVLSKAWNAIPPSKPENLRLWLGKVARNTSINMLETKNTQKHGGITIQLEELSECIPAPLAEKEMDSALLRAFMQNFIKELSPEQRKIFALRYWHCESVSCIAKRFGYSENKTSLILFRIRKRLKKELEKEGLYP